VWDETVVLDQNCVGNFVLVSSGIRALVRSVLEIVGLMSNAIRYGDNLRETHLKNVLSPIDENEDQSINDRLVYAVEMAERSAG
jgi:hypothetical protein